MNNKQDFSWIEHRWFTPICLVLAFVLFTPALFLPLMSDDIFHALAITKPDLDTYNMHWFWNLFSFYDGTPERTQQFIAKLGLPWWTHPEIKINFFRPLTNITHWIDYQLWPNSTFMMHLQNLLWYLASVVGILLLYKKIYHDKIIALLGLLIFTISFHHMSPAYWIASRNSILCGLFAIIATYFFIQFCQQKSGASYLLAIIAFVFALGSGEAGLATTPFLFSAVVIFISGNIVQRLAWLLPFAIISLVYLYIHSTLGYGTANSIFYSSPSDGLANFIQTILIRLPILASYNFFNLRGKDIISDLENNWILSIILGILFLLFVIKLLWPVIRSSKAAQFWALSYIFVLIPFCGTEVSSRTLFIPSIISSALLAQLFIHYRSYWGFSKKNLKSISAWVIKYLLAIHLFLVPLAHLAAFMIDKDIFQTQFNLEKAISQQSLKADDRVFYFSSLSAAGVANAAYTYLKKDINQVPKQIISLANSIETITITRTDDKSIEVFTQNGEELLSEARDFTGRVSNNINTNPFTVGKTYQTGDVAIEILSLNEKHNVPNRIRYTFNQSIDHIPYHFFSTNPKFEFIPLSMPEIGKSISLKMTRPTPHFKFFGDLSKDE